MPYSVEGLKAANAAIAAELLRDTLVQLEPAAIGAERALRACATVAPGQCLQFLVENVSLTHSSIGAAARSRIIEAALTELLSGARANGGHLEALAAAYCDDLSPPALAALLTLCAQPIPAAVARAVDAALERSPHDPTLLRAALNLAQRGQDFARADRLLTALGLADNRIATVSSVFRNRRPENAPGAGVRVALLGTYTLDQLVPFVDLECRALGLASQIYVAPFNSWTRELIDVTSGLRQFGHDIAFLAVSIDDLIPQLAQPLGVNELADLATAALERIQTAVTAYHAWAGGKPLIVHALHSAFETGPLGIAEGRDGRSRREWLAGLNLQLAALLRGMPDTYLLDVLATLAQSGASLADNAKLRHLGAMRLPAPALGAVAKAYACYIAPLKGLTKKCVVLDLDNTLWGGVVGEDGKDAIRLGDTSPGSEYVEFQHFLDGLRQRGVLLALNSKNNADEALDTIRTHASMVLRETAFSAIRINWQAKPENMAAIAQELNIGLDSLVFVDDNPDERELMRRMLPQVLTVELPKDPAQYRSTLESLPQLGVLSITAEDRSRAKQYRSGEQRDGLKLSAVSTEDYLHSLQIEASIARASKPVFARVTQLFARTNQFNATTRRYGPSDVERFAGDPTSRLYGLSSRDRFSDHGLVAVGLVAVSEHTWTIDSLLMSCRVIGYGIESALLAFISEEAERYGATRLCGEFVPTPKNLPAKDVFARHGFAACAAGDETEYWERSLDDGPIPRPRWIRLTSRDA